MSKTFTYCAEMYIWQDGQKQHAYTLNGEVLAAGFYTAQYQAHFDILVKRVEADAAFTERTHIGEICVKEGE